MAALQAWPKPYWPVQQYRVLIQPVTRAVLLVAIDLASWLCRITPGTAVVLGGGPSSTRRDPCLLYDADQGTGVYLYCLRHSPLGGGGYGSAHGEVPLEKSMCERLATV
jgi:hypothetical protein